MAEAHVYRVVESDLGRFMLYRHDRDQFGAEWLLENDQPEDRWREDDGALNDAVDELDAYFAGERVDFHHVPTPAGSPFFRACWRACREIAPGTTISYGELARQAGGSPRTARAAGQAMRRNPLPVIVPCHRVVAASGKLHGFAGTCDASSYWLGLKRDLLALDARSAAALCVG